VALVEPPAATTNAELTVSLSATSGRTVSVKYATVAGTARASADFVTKSGSVIFPPGVTNLPILVAVKSDAEHELDEMFAVILSAPVNATLGVTQAVCTIVGEFVPAPAFVAAPELRLEAGFANGELQLRFITAPGERYRVERSGDLSDPAGWVPLGGAAEIIGTGDVRVILDPGASGRPQGFYRLRRLP
jgi:hypothetical protein